LFQGTLDLLTYGSLNSERNLYTYGSFCLASLVNSNPNHWLAPYVSSALNHPNLLVGGALLTLTTCIDLYRLHNEDIGGTTVLTNFCKNLTTTSAGLLGGYVAGLALGAAAAGTLVGGGLILGAGLLLSWAADLAFEKLVDFIHHTQKINQMKVNAGTLLGLDWDQCTPDDLVHRWKAVVLYVYPDKSISKKTSLGEFFILLKECKEFLEKPQLNNNGRLKTLEYVK